MRELILLHHQSVPYRMDTQLRAQWNFPARRGAYSCGQMKKACGYVMRLSINSHFFAMME